MSDPENQDHPAGAKALANGGTAVAAGQGGIAVGGNYYNFPLAPPPAAVPPKVAPTRLTHVAEHLFGRETELARLDTAWANPNTHVVTLVAWGGTGKTSLAAKWAAGLDLGGADYFDWSFYSQGTREEGSASGEPFVNAALRFFGEAEGERIADSSISGWDKGAKLAGFVARRKALLILDGLEPLQYSPSSPLAGQLKDPGVTALLKGLAAHNPGLCVVTTRECVTDLAAFWDRTVSERPLDQLSERAGAALLEKLQVKGRKVELEKLVKDVDGHALTLNLIGTYLAKAHGGDVRRRDRIDLEKADLKLRGGHAFRAVAAYEKWFIGEGGEEGARQLAVLRLLGLFDRPANAACLGALRDEPVIPRLTDSLVGLDEEDWNLAVSVLTESGLISAEANGTLDAHPLLREYFALQVRDHHPEAWRAGHGRLFEHLRDTTPYQPDTLEGLQPLYQAVAHGCHAGRLEEARGGIYDRRILRGSGRDGFFSINNLGAFGADLGALACFFDSPWCIVSPSQSKAAQAWLLNEAASRLRAMGRLIEAKEAMQNSIGTDVAEKSWKGAAISASNLSEIERTLGEISASLRDAEKARDFADRSGDPFWRMGTRTNYASALHQVGRRAEALLLFREAELMQAEREPRCPLLHSVQGFAYCDLQLAEAEREAGRRKGIARKVPVLAEAIRKVGARASYAIKIAELNQWLLDIALDHLTLGRAALYRAILEGSDLALARSAIEQAVAGLRRAGTTHHVPKALLTRAWFHFRENNPAAARADLDEAQEIAERGPMPLYLADIALYRGRLFGDRAALAEARRLIVKHGYGRRLGELEDAEAALGAAG